MSLWQYCNVTGIKQPSLWWVFPPPRPRGVWNLLDGFVAGAFTEDQQSGSGTHQQTPHLQALDGGHSLRGKNSVERKAKWFR